MTPPAATVAGRGIPRTVAPRRPRRVSGPARPAHGGRAAAPPRATTRRGAADPLAVRALCRARALADSRFLDRLVHGRLWIPLVAAGLMGIVFMQVSMLKLNAGIGRAVQSASTLERQNAQMRADVSRMEAGDRIDRVAHDLGMVVPADGGEHYVAAGDRETAARAAQRMTAPDSGAIARAQGTAPGTAAAGATPPAAGSAPAQTAAAPASANATATATATATTAATPPAPAAPTGAAAAPAQTPAPPTTPSAAAQQAPAPTATGTTGGTAAGGVAAGDGQG